MGLKRGKFSATFIAPLIAACFEVNKQKPLLRELQMELPPSFAVNQADHTFCDCKTREVSIACETL